MSENGLYVGGFTTDGQARVEYLFYGSGTPETIFENFAENGEVYSLCTAPDGSIYAGLKGLAVPVPAPTSRFFAYCSMDCGFPSGLI